MADDARTAPPDTVHDDLDAYLAFRAAFGRPPFVPPDRAARRAVSTATRQSRA